MERLYVNLMALTVDISILIISGIGMVASSRPLEYVCLYQDLSLREDFGI